MPDRVSAPAKAPPRNHKYTSPCCGPIAIAVKPHPPDYEETMKGDKSLCLGRKGCDGNIPLGSLCDYVDLGDPIPTNSQFPNLPARYLTCPRDLRAWWKQLCSFDGSVLSHVQNYERPFNVISTHQFYPVPQQNPTLSAANPMPILSNQEGVSSRDHRPPCGPYRCTYNKKGR